ncbi:MAG: hypothetical protein WCY71_00720 [Halothiobacillaceae bacterium]
MKTDERIRWSVIFMRSTVTDLNVNASDIQSGSREALPRSSARIAGDIRRHDGSNTGLDLEVAVSGT